MALQKIREFTGLTKVAPSNIESRSIESALRDEGYAFDLQLHDLRSEFIAREQKLRAAYLEKVAEITAAG